MSPGQVIDGLVVSTTVTLNVHVELFALESVAVHVTVVAPNTKVLPEGGTQTTTGLGSVLSVAVGFG
jgi:hypothetical protein